MVEGAVRHGTLVYVNTLMIQDLIDDPGYRRHPRHRRRQARGVTIHVLPYGEVKLNMSSRLTLSGL